MDSLNLTLQDEKFYEFWYVTEVSGLLYYLFYCNKKNAFGRIILQGRS